MRGRRKTGLDESITVVVAKEGDGGERREGTRKGGACVTMCYWCDTLTVIMLHESVLFWLFARGWKGREDQ